VLTALSVVAAALAAGGVALVVAPGARLATPLTPSGRVEEQAVLRRLRPALAALALVGGWAVVGGVFGLAAGAVAAAMSWRVLSHAESPAARRRREELERDLPVAVQLVGACLTAGAATSAALDDVAQALPGAVSEELLLVRHRLALGVDPAAVWRLLAEHPQLGPLGRSLGRAHRSGASARDAIAALAAELAAESRARVDALARGVEVKAAAPLGVCFLPAFVLLGVVPMVVGVFSALRLFG
jgi:pilus assembly protein TadC